jgi:hypothetical protein
LGWFKRGKVLENKKIGEEEETWSFFGKRIGELEVFVVENHKLYFDIAHIFFNKTWDCDVI